MAYHDWLRALSRLPKTAEFCLADVTERVSAGDKVLNFVISEAVGKDLISTGRRGQTEEVCRPRIYVALAEVDAEHKRIEIAEPLKDVEKAMTRNCEFSLWEFYRFNNKLCESVLASLTVKIGVMSEHSAAVLESQLGKEIIQLITNRLEGGDEEQANLKSLLIQHLASAMPKHIIKPIAGFKNASIRQLSVCENDIEWAYEFHGMRASLTLNWKGITLQWAEKKVDVLGNRKELCSRDMFLFLVNLPAFGQIVAAKLAKVMA